MYNELYASWRREIDDPTLGALPPDFYTRIYTYMQSIKRQDQVIDKKSVKMNLLEHEAQNVKRMLEELLTARYRKIIKTITRSQKLPIELLATDEAKMCETFVDFARTYRKFTENLLQGQLSSQPIKVIIKSETAPIPQASKRSTVRFLKNIPAIMGSDMKSYGPFVAEDVASLPPANAQVLVKQGLAVLVDVS